MQISIVLCKERIELPIAAVETVQGLIYRALSEDSKYFDHVHEEGKHFAGRTYKLFTFGDLRGKYEIDGKRIVYRSSVCLDVRSTDAYLIQLLLIYFQKNRTVRLGDNTVSVGSVTLDDTHIFENRILVHTHSPITVYMTEKNGHTVYFSPQDPRFTEAIETNARRKWASYTGSEAGFALRVIVPEGVCGVKRATRFKSTFITAWHLPLILEGTPQVLDFLYQTGLGSKNSQGFGMFELDR